MKDVYKRQDIILLDVDDLDHSHKRIEKLLKRKHRPQAIFTSNDMLAFGVYRAAYNCGIRIPEDLSVMGYDNIITVSYTHLAGGPEGDPERGRTGR